MDSREGDLGNFEPAIQGYQASAGANGANPHSLSTAAKPAQPSGFAHFGGQNPLTEMPKDKNVLDIIKADATRHKKVLSIIAAGLFIASSFFFFSYVKEALLLTAFIALGAVSRMWQRFFPISFGVELVMLSTVISAILYGPVAGLIVGFLSLSISTLVTQEDLGKMWPSFFIIALIGFVAGTMQIQNIALWGLGLTVAYDVIISIVYIAMGHSIIKTLIFDTTHIAFNYFVFFNVAPLLMKLVA